MKFADKVQTYEEARQTVVDALSKKKNYGTTCNCGNRAHTVIGFYDEKEDFLEVRQYCIRCGGHQEER